MLNNYYKFQAKFFDIMMRFTKPKNKYFFSWIFNAWIFADQISQDVVDFYSEKLPSIYQYIEEHNLLTEENTWEHYGIGVYLLISTNPKELVMPKDLKTFVIEQFEGRKITLKKINGAYIVVFDE